MAPQLAAVRHMPGTVGAIGQTMNQPYTKHTWRDRSGAGSRTSQAARSNTPGDLPTALSYRFPVYQGRTAWLTVGLSTFRWPSSVAILPGRLDLTVYSDAKVTSTA